MSRVKTRQKFMNTNKYDSSITGPSKLTRIHFDVEDYHKAKTLTDWLFVKYDMSYKTYRKKSKNRKNELRDEFEKDTGITIKSPEEIEREDAMGLLRSCGVPFSPFDDPLGIWDD